MRVKQYLRWELLLALSLVGCTSVVPNRTGLPQQPVTAVQDIQPVSGLNLGTRLLFQVRWPTEAGFNAQVISPDTAKIEVKIIKGGHDPAASGAVVDSRELLRPAAGEGDTTTATFNLDPALKTVDVYVRALRGDGSEASSGNRKGVPVRDNTTTGITVTLLPGGNLPELDKARIVDHLRLLAALPAYFKDYDQLIRYPESQAAKDLTASMEGIFKEWMPRNEIREPDYSDGGTMPGDGDTFQSPPPMTAYRTGSRYTVAGIGVGGADRLINPKNPQMMLDVLNGEVKKLYWPGYEAEATYTEDGLKHQFSLTVSPPQSGGGDGTRANLAAELTASSWVPEPSLTQSLDAWRDTGTATESIVMQLTHLGGKKPVDGTITGGRLSFDIVPKGIVSNTFGVMLMADRFREISNTPLYLAATERSPSSRQATSVPQHAVIGLQTPPVAATADVTINDDFLGLKSRTELKVKRNDGTGFGAFVLELGGSMRLGAVGGYTEPVGANLGFSLFDPAQKLRLEGGVQLQRTPFKATFVGRFIDVPTNTVVGTIDYDLPVDANGKVDMNHLSSWPILKLVDDKNTQFRLTPGFFSGETNGFVRVDVR